MGTFDNPSMFFRKRKGTTNKGTAYENLTIARIALDLTLDNTVKDFKISSNDDSFGAFDDVIVEIEYTTGKVSKYAIQLKYSNDRLLTKSSLADQRGNFSIKKYFDSYKKLRNVDDFIFVLFTNREFEISDKEVKNSHGETVKVEYDKTIRFDNLELTIEESEDSLKISSGRCFKLVSKSANAFFDKFFIYTNQIDVDSLETCLSIEFVDFVRKWSDFEGKKIKLYKYFVRRKLALILLSPHIVKHDFTDCHTNDQEILRRFIDKHKVVEFSKNVGHEVAKLWSKSEEADARKLCHLYQLSSTGLDNDDIYTRLMWLIGKCPLIVNDGETTRRAIELCPDRNFVILGRAQKLSDFDTTHELENLTCCIQGKAINMNTLVDGGRLSTILTTDHLVTKLSIGVKEVLPTTHISRSLTRTTLKWDVLDRIDFGLGREALVVITNYKQCPQMKYRTLRSDDYLEAEEFAWEFCNGKVIFVTEKEYSMEDFDKICSLNRGKNNYYQFRLTDGLLDLVRSRGGVTGLENYLLDCYLTEEELLNREKDSKIHIVCAGPGMGKSTLMKNIKNKSSPKIWTHLIPVRNYVGYLTNKETFMNHVFSELDTFEREVVQILLEEKRIKLIWDGLDEISSKNFDLVLDLIDEFETMGVTQWITSRDNLKETLQRRFGVLARKIREFDEDEQRKYIEKRLNCSGDDLNDIFSRIKKNIQLFPDNDILGIPLQIYILTELLLQDKERYINVLDNLFSIADLYEHFVAEKFRIYCNEKENIMSKNDLLDERNRRFKLEQIDNYEKIAAQTFDFGVSKISLTKEKDPIGIIVKFGTFLHTSFCEYFAASFLSKNRHFLAKFSDFLCDVKYNNVRFFFDLLMAKNCQPHIAVLYRNVKLLRSCTNEELLIIKDQAGRNALQVACTWGQKYPIFKLYENCIDDIHFVTRHKDSPEYCEIFDTLSKVCDRSERDSLFNLTPVSYAYKSLCLMSFVKLIKCYKVNFEDFDSAESICSIIYHCVMLDFDDIFSIVKNIPPDIETMRYDSFLDLAARHNSIRCVKTLTTLFDNRFDLEPSMIKASGLGYNRIVKFFIDSGVNINACDFFGETPILAACKNRQCDVVKLLIDNGADVNQCLLYLAVKSDYFDLVKLLFHGGATVDDDIIHHADSIDIIHFLIDKVSNLNSHDRHGETLIHKRCLAEDYDTVKLLIDNNVDVNVINANHQTPLHLTCARNNLDIVKLLVENNAAINTADESGKTPLHLVNDARIVKYLVDNKADCMSDMSGNTPLHSAAECGNCDAVKLLLQCQKSVNCQNKHGETALHIACERGEVDIVKLLIDNGADVNLTALHDKTPLHCSKNFSICQLLIDNGATVNAVNVYGETPIHLCCELGCHDIVKLLIDSGSSVNTVTNYDETPIAMAKKWPKIVNLLKNK